MINVDSNGFPAGVGFNGEEADDTTEDGDERSPDLRAAEAVDVEVESEVEELQVVGHSSEHLEAEVVVELCGKEEGEDGCGCGAADKEDNY